MAQVKTGYQSLEELLLDFDIYGTLISEPQIPLEEFKEMLYQDFKKTRLVSLEDRRYILGDIVSSESRVTYYNQIELQEDEEELSLGLDDDDEFIEDSSEDYNSYLKLPDEEEFSRYLANKSNTSSEEENIDIEGLEGSLEDTVDEDYTESFESEHFDEDLVPLSDEMRDRAESNFGTTAVGSELTVVEDTYDEDEEEYVEDSGYWDEVDALEQEQSGNEVEDEWSDSSDEVDEADEYADDYESDLDYAEDLTEDEVEEDASVDEDGWNDFDDSDEDAWGDPVDEDIAEVDSDWDDNDEIQQREVVNEPDLQSSPVRQPQSENLDRGSDAVNIVSVETNTSRVVETPKRPIKKKKKKKPVQQRSQQPQADIDRRVPKNVPPPPIPKPNKPKVESAPVQTSSVIEPEPTNLRDFLRKHPHSDLNFVLKYFSRKEVQKALALGQVIKKGNKLHI